MGPIRVAPASRRDAMISCRRDVGAWKRINVDAYAKSGTQICELWHGTTARRDGFATRCVPRVVAIAATPSPPEKA
ncbi:hypothetical protein Y032_0034g2899 [Ancylostoma ceylanicum]|uniref:Uncharacterized protein n=1 Tax=Ancylostoma ceylanicum TaxID=53326 RepID=A0A016UM59_9BILA|nr:hypothetical protein Y032_0034g2899 [Ancylostoma ceylanicum]